MPGPFVIVRDPRDSVVHICKQDGECVGCIEVGLYEIVRRLILAEQGTVPGATGEGRSPPNTVPRRLWRWAEDGAR